MHHLVHQYIVHGVKIREPVVRTITSEETKTQIIYSEPLQPVHV